MRSILGATAGESEQIVGLLEVLESGFPSSHFIKTSVGVATHVFGRGPLAFAAPTSVAHALAGSSPPVCAPAIVFAAAADARATASPLHVARNSSQCCSQGPTERTGTKGGVPSPTEDLRPVPEVETGVNFRLAGRVRVQVVEHCPRRRPGPVPGGPKVGR